MAVQRPLYPTKESVDTDIQNKENMSGFGMNNS
jgi:hypothetical protein